jgi:hypothetical protein
MIRFPHRLNGSGGDRVPKGPTSFGGVVVVCGEQSQWRTMLGGGGGCRSWSDYGSTKSTSRSGRLPHRAVGQQLMEEHGHNYHFRQIFFFSSPLLPLMAL